MKFVCYHHQYIRLTKPSFYWQPGAIDKDTLFWLNYKNAYEHCNEQRGAFTTPTSDSTRLRSIVNVPTSPATTIQGVRKFIDQK